MVLERSQMLSSANMVEAVRQSFDGEERSKWPEAVVHRNDVLRWAEAKRLQKGQKIARIEDEHVRRRSAQLQRCDRGRGKRVDSCESCHASRY